MHRCTSSSLRFLFACWFVVLSRLCEANCEAGQCTSVASNGELSLLQRAGSSGQAAELTKVIVPKSSLITIGRPMSLVLKDVPGLLAASSCVDANEIPVNDLKTGLALGAQFLMHSQTPEGNFRYEYNWKTKQDSHDDNSVRQGGTLWGLVLAHADSPDSTLYLPSIRKALNFFALHSVTLADGRRLIQYPGQPNKLGTVALVALAHIDLLRQPEKLADTTEKAALEDNLDGYLKTLLQNEFNTSEGQPDFRKSYQNNGQPKGKGSPYYDGECLLALIKAAKYLGRTDLWDRIERMADGGWKVNVEPGLTDVEKHGPKKATKEMKGYYQWSSMSWYELLEADNERFARFAPRLLHYADWMVGVQESSKGNGNTGYAFEGLIPAYLVAVSQNDDIRANRIACALRKSIHRLNGMQVGHPKARGITQDAPVEDTRARGGAQNAGDSPLLRIDTTQHQMHAVLMMKLLLEEKQLI